MRTDIIDLVEFYASPLGRSACDQIATRLVEAWSDAARLRIAGYGYAEPFLDRFPTAERTLALAPASQGVVHWPSRDCNRAALVGERRWPLPDASIDRLLIIHGLEESADPHRLLREAWRVLTSDGRIVIVASHRRGFWSMVETTPFAAGRPYLKRQLERLLSESLLRPLAWSGALYFPPVRWKALLAGSEAWERAGSKLWPFLSGAILVEATKDMLAPAGLVAARPRIAVRVAATKQSGISPTTNSGEAKLR